VLALTPLAVAVAIALALVPTDLVVPAVVPIEKEFILVLGLIPPPLLSSSYEVEEE
jgi:hypothetical protein